MLDRVAKIKNKHEEDVRIQVEKELKKEKEN